MSKISTEPDVSPITMDKKVTKTEMQTVFRSLFAGDSTLTELFARDVILTLQDIQELNRKIAEKLVRNNVSVLSFQAFARFEKGKTKEYGDWDSFSSDDWTIPEVLNSLQLNWRFMLEDCTQSKYHLHTLSVFCSSWLNPQQVMQAIFSNDPADIERLDFKACPVSCRIDFTDHVISQELMNLVSEWNKGLSTPQYIFPIMKKFKAHSDLIAKAVNTSIPILTGLACFAYFHHATHNLTAQDPASVGMIRDTVIWLAVSAFSLFLANRLSATVAERIKTLLFHFGRFTVFSLTKGDFARQDELMVNGTRTLYRFLAMSCLAILWNVVGGIVTVVLLGK